MPFLTAEGRLALREISRRLLEDELEIASEQVRLIETALKAKLKKRDTDNLAATLNNKENKTFTDDERKRHEDATERVQKLNLGCVRAFSAVGDLRGRPGVREDGDGREW